MKYEEIKIGESYSSVPYIETVIFKHDKSKSIICEDQNGVVSIYHSDEFEDFKPLKEEVSTLELVSKAVQDLGDFTIEQTESGVIILTPLS